MISAVLNVCSRRVRLLVAKNSGAAPTVILEREVLTRLGEDYPRLGELSESAIAETIAAIKDCREEALKYTNDISTFSSEFSPEIAAELSHQVMLQAANPIIIPHNEQLSAQLYMGASGNRFNCVILDTGGLYTRILTSRICELSSLTRSLGSFRLKHSFPVTDVFTEEHFSQITNYILSRLKDYTPLKINGRLPLIAVSGIAHALGAIKLSLPAGSPDVQDAQLSFEDIEVLTRRLCKTTLAERRTLTGLYPADADLLPYEALVVYTFMKKYNFPALHVSRQDYLQGFLKQKWEGRV